MVIDMKEINEEQRVMELEYKLICDFIKLREMIAVIENRKKLPQINTLIKILEPFGYTLSITKIVED